MRWMLSGILAGGALVHNEADFADAFRVVPDAFEFHGDLQHRHQGPQVDRQRLLSGDEVGATLFKDEPLLVHDVVVEDNLIGQLRVAGGQSFHRLHDGPFDQLGQLQQLLLQIVQIAVETGAYHDLLPETSRNVGFGAFVLRVGEDKAAFAELDKGPASVPFVAQEERGVV